MLKQIDCLNKIFGLLKCRNDILEFLVSEKLITSDKMHHILHSTPTTHATTIAFLLKELQHEEKVQLVSYEWTVLPKEYINLTIVTNSSKKEWTYGI